MINLILVILYGIMGCGRSEAGVSIVIKNSLTFVPLTSFGL